MPRQNHNVAFCIYVGALNPSAIHAAKATKWRKRAMWCHYQRERTFVPIHMRKINGGFPSAQSTMPSPLYWLQAAEKLAAPPWKSQTKSGRSQTETRRRRSSRSEYPCGFQGSIQISSWQYHLNIWKRKLAQKIHPQLISRYLASP